MLTLPVYNISGEKKGNFKIPFSLDIKISPSLIHQAVVSQQSAKIVSGGHTKTRGERRGGGRKPWRQKGTGRARAGSIRSPIWRKGGVVFGPKGVENFAKKINKMQKKKAILAALAEKIKNNEAFILEGLKIDQIKTKKMAQILSNLPFQGSFLIILESWDEKIFKSSRNIPYLKVLLVSNLNIVDILKYSYLIFTKESLKKIAQKSTLRSNQS